jgi:hypothetical protein
VRRRSPNGRGEAVGAGENDGVGEPEFVGVGEPEFVGVGEPEVGGAGVPEVASAGEGERGGAPVIAAEAARAVAAAKAGWAKANVALATTLARRARNASGDAVSHGFVNRNDTAELRRGRECTSAKEEYVPVRLLVNARNAAFRRRDDETRDARRTRSIR